MVIVPAPPWAPSEGREPWLELKLSAVKLRTNSAGAVESPPHPDTVSATTPASTIPVMAWKTIATPG